MKTFIFYAQRALVFALTFCVALPAFAQDPAAPPPAEAPTTAVLADTDKVPDAPDLKKKSTETDSLELKLNGGGASNSGNTRSFAVNAGFNFNFRKNKDQAIADGQYVYATAALRDATTQQFGAYTKNADNFNTGVRYNRYLTHFDALYAGGKMRIDPFAGLDLRLQGQAGYMRDIFSQDNHRLWAEVGYDLTYDNYVGAAGNAVYNSVRLFAGYDNHINEMVTFLTGFEGLYTFTHPTGYDKTVRINWVSSLTSKLYDKFSVALTYVFRYDAHPIPSYFGHVDSLTTVNLVYSLL